MNEFKTKVEFLGESRPALIGWEPIDGECWIQRVEIALVIQHEWTPQGINRRWCERCAFDVKELLSDEQIYELAQEIKADQQATAADDYSDSRAMDAQERWFRMYGRHVAA